MIPMKMFFSHLMTEVSAARRLADLQAIEDAKQMANDEWLRHFPTPRYRISEVEIDAPLVVSNLELKSQRTIFLKDADFIELSKEILFAGLKQSLGGKPLRFDASFKERSLQMRTELEQVLAKEDTLTSEQLILKMGPIFDKHIEAHLKKLGPENLLAAGFKPSDSAIKQIKTQFEEKVFKGIKASSVILQEMQVNPITSAVSGLLPSQSLLRVKFRLSDQEIDLAPVIENRS